MKVAMVYPLPSPSSPQQNTALSIIYPGRAAEDAGHTVSFWDARLDSEIELWENVSHADVMAISSLSGFQLGESIKIARACRKQFPKKPIIWGGVHVTFQPIESLREPFVDFCIIGEGEVRFVKLLAAISNGTGFRNIDGISYKKASVGFSPSPEELEDFKKLGSATQGVQLKVIAGSAKERIEIHDPDGAYDNGQTVVHRRGLALNLAQEYVSAISPATERLWIASALRNEVIFQVSRGCSWSMTSCEFCSVAGQFTQFNPKTGRSTSVYRHIPYELWARDVIAIHTLKPFTFLELEDENSLHFLKDWRYAQLLYQMGIGYHLHLRSDQLKNEQVIEKLAATGCVRIHAGLESGNNKTLALMRKNEPVSDHYVAAKLLAKHGIGLIATWIVGNPGEPTESIFDTLRVSDEIRTIFPPEKTRATIYVLMPLLGTIAFNRAKEAGWLLPTTMEGWSEISATYNPKIPQWINNLYFIAGFHHNRHHKARQNWPGWWRLLILPFELIIEERWQLGIKTKNPAYFSYFSFEYWCIVRLLKWRSRKSVGEGKAQLPKLLERLIPGLAGH